MILCLSNIPQNHFLRNCKMLTSYYSQRLHATKNVQIADGEIKNTRAKQNYSKLLYYNNSSTSHEIFHLLAF